MDQDRIALADIKERHDELSLMRFLRNRMPDDVRKEAEHENGEAE